MFSDRPAARAAASALALVLLAGCGIKGPPRPPLSKAPEAVRELEVRQSGGVLSVCWLAPTRRQDGGPLGPDLNYEVLAQAVERQTWAGAAVRAGGPKRTGGVSSLLSSRQGAEEGSQNAAASLRAQALFLKSATVVRKVSGSRAPAPGSGLAGQAAPPAHPIAGSDRAAPPLTAFAAELGAGDFPGLRLSATGLEISVVAVDLRGRRSPPRPIVEIDPVDPLPALSFSAAAPTAEGVSLSWSFPPAVPTQSASGHNEAGSAPSPGDHEAGSAPSSGNHDSAPAPSERQAGQPPPLVGVNVYRAEAGAPIPFDPIPGSPFPGTEALDASAKIGGRYRYQARAVSLAPGKGRREGPPSAPVDVSFLDRFAPGPPALVTLDLSPSETEGGRVWSVRIAWSPPIDSDVAGYKVYRAEGDGGFVLVAGLPATAAGWEDKTVAAGRRYRYSVTAIDGADPANESARSEIVEGTLPAPGETGEKP
jgi:hypothetical protein